MVLARAKGFRGARRRRYRIANETLLHAMRYQYRDRRQRKRDFRRLWITRINAGARQHGLSYSRFIHGLRLVDVEVDRKILADLAVREPAAFAKLVAVAKDALD
jgi:large subunit ribosomal protein L20